MVNTQLVPLHENVTKSIYFESKGAAFLNVQQIYPSTTHPYK